MPGFELIGKEELNNIKEIFDKSNGVLFAHGFENLRNNKYRVRELEKEFSKFVGSKHCLAVTSGTIAQYVAMKAMGIKQGDEVITQSFTFVATVEAIIALGAEPIIVDINETYNMDPEELEKAITPKTKLIIPVHMLGNPAQMNEINKIGSKYNIPVLEDGCEALGAMYDGKYVGNLSEVSVFSLDFAKTITCGEGGLITTNNDEILKYCKEFHDHGHESNKSLPRGRDTRTIPGLNFRITEMQAAVASAQLSKINLILKRNKTNKTILKDYLSQSSKINFRKITDEEGDLADTIIFNFENETITNNFLDKLISQGFITKNVPDAIDWHFSGTWNHMFENVERYKYTWNSEWEKSRRLLKRSIALPIFLNKTEEQMMDQGKSILKILKEI